MVRPGSFSRSTEDAECKPGEMNGGTKIMRANSPPGATVQILTLFPQMSMILGFAFLAASVAIFLSCIRGEIKRSTHGSSVGDLPVEKALQGAAKR